MEDDFSISNTGDFLPLFFHSILKIFHSIFHFILKFSSIFHSILPYQGKFGPEATRNLYCSFAALNVLLQVVALEGKQYDAVHLIPYLKHYRHDLPQKFTQHKNINRRRCQDFWLGGERGGQNANHKQWWHQKFSNDGIFMGQKYRRMEGQKLGPVCEAHNHDFARGGDLQPKVIKFSQNV